MEKFGLKCENNPLQHVQLVLERDKIIDQRFMLQIKLKEHLFYRLPT